MSPRADSPEPCAPPLSRAEANEVLRYWLASLQLEEALSARPRARRLRADTVEPRLDAPSAGQEYFKVALDGAFDALLLERSVLCKGLDAELAAFFETWLLAQYRRRGDERELAHLLAFPVVHLPRGELAGLLRYGVRLRFGEPGGADFKVPTHGERRRKQYPTAPSEARLTAIERTGRQWPFFVDTRLLHQQLGVSRESIDALFDDLRSRSEVSEREMLALVCDVLENELRGEEGTGSSAASSSGRLLERITAAVGGLLARRGGRGRVYPVGIVLDSTRAKTTWYLQRELRELLDEVSDVSWDLDSCLGAYLTRTAAPMGMAVQRALFPGPTLSESQRIAAERCWGSRLSAVQGPPGTGKTTLILHLAAEALVRQVDQLADGGAMGDGLLVVASTNNRAVDNVVDPLRAHESSGLPLALRAGSQRVCEHLLAPQLAQACVWLERAKQQRTAAERDATLVSALEHFRSVRAELDELLAPRVRVLAARTERDDLARAIGRLQAELEATRDSPIDAERASRVRAPLENVRRRLDALSELCEATPGLAQLKAVDRHFRSTSKRALGAVEDAAGFALELGLPPDLPPSRDPAVLMDAWELATASALARVDALLEQVARASADRARRDRMRVLRRRLDALGPEMPEAPAPAVPADLQRALFEAAVAARDAWAAAHSDALLPVVHAAVEAARTDASLRSLWSDEARRWRPLRQLFGVWGCTLLSMGNCFPAQPEAIQRLVIDEAGQCHPTYAISGLLRSQFALVIGDVHQLEPVIELEPDDDERMIQSCKLTLTLERLAPYRVHSQSQSSVQSLADRAVVERPRLIDHFRCQPEIIAISDALCDYGLRVHSVRQGPAVPLPFLQHPVSFVDVAGEQERVGGSWCNAAELALTVELLQNLLAFGIDARDVAVITPYRGQLEHLRRQFVRAGIPVDSSVELLDLEEPSFGAAVRGTALGTVHRFQGGERSIVLFSSVITRRSSLGFLDDRENLLNVAVSRARHRLIALGSRAVLETGRRTRLLTRAAEPLLPDAFRQQLGLRV